MKKNLLLSIILMIGFAQSLTAQTSVTLAAGSASNAPSSACLSCPGSNWNNTANVTVLDGTPADVSLMQNSFCFQSTCYYSRSLIAYQYGFSIPGTATILGIEVNIVREGPAVNTIRDTTVLILQNGTLASSNYKSGTFWPATYANQLYGGPSDLWGLTWTPADINNPLTALRLGVYNTTASSVSGVNVDFVSMTVYYSTVTGIIGSQTLSPNIFSLYPNPSENILNIESHIKMDGVIIFDIMGRKVLEQKENVSQINIQSLEKGMYQLIITSEGKNYPGKFIKE